MEEHHHAHHGRDRAEIAEPNPPLDPWTRQAMQPVEPDSGDRAGDMDPIDDRATQRLFQFETAGPCQEQARQQNGHSRREQRVADPNRPLVLAMASRPEMADAEQQVRDNQQEPEREMRQKHVLVEVVLKNPLLPGKRRCEPFQEGDRSEVNRVGA